MTREVRRVLEWAAAFMCDGSGRLWSRGPGPRGERARMRWALRHMNDTCISVKAHRRCTSCRARLLLKRVQ